HNCIKNTPSVVYLSKNKDLNKEIHNNIKEYSINKIKADNRLFTDNIQIQDTIRIFNGVLDAEYRKKEKSLPIANKKYKTQFSNDVYKVIKIINSKPNKQYIVELISLKTVFNELNMTLRVQRQDIIKVDYYNMVKTQNISKKVLPKDEY